MSAQRLHDKKKDAPKKRVRLDEERRGAERPFPVQDERGVGLDLVVEARKR